MKFLLIVLAIHLVGELIGNKRKNSSDEFQPEMKNNVLHPAEFELR